MSAMLGLAFLVGVPLLLYRAVARGSATRRAVEVKRLVMLRLLTTAENDLPITAAQMIQLAELARDVGTTEEQDRVRAVAARL